MATERYVSRLGVTDYDDYVVVTLEIRTRSGEGFQTVNHEDISGDIMEVSLTGEAGSKYAPGRSITSAGQIVDALAHITNPAPGWTASEIRRVRALWERWHLNTMRAACAHMDESTLVREDDSYGGTYISTRAPENVCPESGYQYGHAWLTEIVPDDVLAELRHLFRDRSEALYRSRGYDGSGKPVQS